MSESVEIPNAVYPPPAIPANQVLSFASFRRRRKAAAVPTVLDVEHRLMLTSGRIALALAMQKLGVVSGDKVLLPAYHCKSMLDPVRWCKGVPVFYKVRPDLSIDPAELDARIDEQTRGLVIVHYFGFPQAVVELRRFCDERGLFLIEDCAHAFFGSIDGAGVGSRGDYAIVSPMKFFPVYDGGMLVSSANPLSNDMLKRGGVGFQAKAFLNVVERAVQFGRLRPLSWILRGLLRAKDRIWSVLKSVRSTDKPRLFGPQAAEGGFDFDPAWIDIRMSDASRFILTRVSYARIVENRRRNFMTLVDAFQGEPGCQMLFPALPASVVPYVFPLVIENPDVVFPRLKRAGVPMFRWEDAEASTCETSTAYSTTLLQLPCHQELTEKDLSWMIDTIKREMRRP